MNTKQLSSWVDESETHRKIVGDYDGSYALGVTDDPPAFLLRVEPADVDPQAQVPYPLAASFVPEQQSHRPLVCGLQVQNVDDDDRQRQAGELGPGFLVIGTLGCFVRLASGSDAALSNNHVLAGENRGRKGQDRILQPGDLTFTAEQFAAT